MVTDFDCWHEVHGPVDVQSVLAQMHSNTIHARSLVEAIAARFPDQPMSCPHGSDRALDGAIITPPEHRDPALLAKLDAILARVSGR
jgi:5'-methylthioadenosine phosphorylase